MTYDVSKYLLLLHDLNLDPPDQPPPPPPQPPPRNLLRCCGPVTPNPLHGNYSCIRCGLVKDPYFIVQEEEPTYPVENTPWGMKSSYTYKKRRFYNPLTHFKEHLRRYLGARFTLIPQELMADLRTMNLNVQHPEAYNTVKTALKSLRHKQYQTSRMNHHTKFTEHRVHRSTNFYKDIFTIIYELGGQKPDFNNMQQLYQKYKDLTYYFTRKKIQLARHNMPCNYMLLDILLRECDHTPHYNLPYLKNINLRDTVIHIFHQLRHDQESS